MREHVSRDRRELWGEILEPYALGNCNPVTGNVYSSQITWQDTDKFPHLPEISTRLVFELKNAKLYSFWIH